MRLRSWCRAFLVGAIAAATVPRAWGAGVAPLFGTTAPLDGPFPSDLFTVSDPAQRTGVRVHLPYPVESPGLECGGDPHATECEDIDVLNGLDGFNVQPRLSIPFSGAIDAASVTGRTVFLLRLGTAGSERDGLAGDDGRNRDEGNGGGERVGINQAVWDVASKTLHLESDALLDQDTRYLLVVTRGVRDASGRPIKRSADFASFRRDLAFGQTRDLPAETRERLKDYRAALVRALDRAEEAGVDEDEIAVASVFTTQSVTAALEQVRAWIRSAPGPEPADFCLLVPAGPGGAAACASGAGGARTVFALGEVQGIRWNQVDTPPTHATRVFDLAARLAQLRAEACGGAPCVGWIAFGRYFSPSFLDPTRTLPPDVGTAAPVREPQGVGVVYFNLFLPTGTPPPGGWPVVMFGHGQGNSKNDWPFTVAGRLAAHGFATIAINLAFHGFGPAGTLAVTPSPAGPAVILPAGGRGVETNGDGIGVVEGNLAAPPRSLLVNADGRLQTSADLMQLVRVIEEGVDVNGDGFRDLDPSRIYSLGFSAGSYVAMGLATVEPAVRATAFATVLASVELFRLDLSTRPMVGTFLQSRVPSLLNSPGLPSIGGVTVGAPWFDENLPLRDQPPVVNTVSGAMPIQEFFERVEWATQSSAPEALAPHLRRAPLAGAPPRPVLIQFAQGDQTAVNPSTARVVRAGELGDRTTGFRYDSFRGALPLIAIPANYPHRFIVSIDAAAAEVRAIALAAQDQAAAFFAAPDAPLPVPSPPAGAFFEVPFQGPIPEDFGFVP